MTWDSAKHVNTSDFHEEKKGCTQDGEADRRGGIVCAMAVTTYDGYDT